MLRERPRRLLPARVSRWTCSCSRSPAEIARRSWGGCIGHALAPAVQCQPQYLPKRQSKREPQVQSRATAIAAARSGPAVPPERVRRHWPAGQASHPARRSDSSKPPQPPSTDVRVPAIARHVREDQAASAFCAVRGDATLRRCMLALALWGGILLMTPSRGALIPPFFFSSVVAIGTHESQPELGGGVGQHWFTEGTGFFYGYLVHDDKDPAKKQYAVYLVTAAHVLKEHPELV